MKMPYTDWTPDTAPFYANGENTAQNCLPYLAAPNYTQSPSVALSAIGPINQSTYNANAVSFAGGTNLFSSAITGLTNGKAFTASIWFRFDASGSPHFISLNEDSNEFVIRISGGAFIQVIGRNSAGTIILSLKTSVNSVSPGSSWHNLLISVNLATGASNMWLDGVSNNIATTVTNDTLAWVGPLNYIGDAADSGNSSAWSESEIWFTNTYLDFSVSGNRLLFYNAGFPVNLGSTGQTPTGTSPLIYQKSQASQVGTNSGTGGNFTLTGTASIASSSPSNGAPSAANSQILGGASFIDSSDVPHTYIGTSAQLAEITPTTANNVSQAGGYSCTTYWKFAGFTNSGTNNVYATDYADAIQVMAVGGTSFANLAGGPPKAKHIGQIGQFIVVANTNGGTYAGGTAGAVPNRVWWPQIGNPANWPDPLTNAGIADQAGVQDLPLVYGACQHVSNGQLYGLVFQEHAITNFYYIGGNTVFQVNTYEKQRGCMCPNGCVQVGDIIYFIDQSGFFATDGATVQPIGHDQVDTTWLADVNTAYLDHVRGSHDASNKCIWWSYPSLTATLLGGFVVCDKVIVYNYADKRWAMGMVGQSIDILFSSYTLGYTMEQLDSVNSNLDLITPSLDSPYWNGGQPVIGVFGIQQIGTSGSYASYSGSLSGPALTALIDTKEMNLNEGGLAFVNNINPVVMGGTLANVQVAPITRNTLSDSAVVGTLVSPSTRTGKVPMRSNARYHRFRVQISGGFQNAMGVEPEFTPSGQA